MPFYISQIRKLKNGKYNILEQVKFDELSINFIYLNSEKRKQFCDKFCLCSNEKDATMFEVLEKKDLYKMGRVYFYPFMKTKRVLMQILTEDDVYNVKN